MTPFFSVIIPTYNRAHVLPRTIESVCKQSFEDFELIVVDDGSKDNTKEIVEELAAKDQRIRYVFQQNAERSAARNNGVANSNGKYMCFLDSDDEYMSHHLQTIYDAIEENGHPKAFFFTSLTIYNDGVDIDHPIEVMDDTKSVYDYLFRSGIYPCRACVHKEIFEDFQFRLDSVIVEDTILWLEIASKYPVIQVPVKTVNYYQHDENSVNKKYNPCQQMLDGIFAFRGNNPGVYNRISKSLRKAIVSDLYYGISVSGIMNKKRWSSIVALIRSIFIDPGNQKTKHKVLLIIRLSTFRAMDRIEGLIQ